MTQSDVVSMTGQIAISSTVLFTSFSSTCMLHLVTHPYVESLHEVMPIKKSSETNTTATNKVDGTRKFIASRYNLFGFSKTTEFSLAEANKNVVNPFASFMVKPGG